MASYCTSSLCITAMYVANSCNELLRSSIYSQSSNIDLLTSLLSLTLKPSSPFFSIHVHGFLSPPSLTLICPSLPSVSEDTLIPTPLHWQHCYPLPPFLLPWVITWGWFCILRSWCPTLWVFCHRSHSLPCHHLPVNNKCQNVKSEKRTLENFPH